MARVNRTGLTDAEPASRNDMFMRAPKKAAKPVRQPTSRPSPTAISPNTMRGANQVYALLSSKVWMNARYHSNVIAGLPAPAAGIATACCQ